MMIVNFPETIFITLVYESFGFNHKCIGNPKHGQSSMFAFLISFPTQTTAIYSISSSFSTPHQKHILENGTPNSHQANNKLQE